MTQDSSPIDGSARPREPVPLEISLAADRRYLDIAWDDGSRDSASAVALREACRSSRSVRARVDGWAVPAPADISIVEVRPVGRYAINLVFSDGHDRGIYPWSYLKGLVRQESGGQGN